MPRIISGTAGGIPLASPRGLQTRPTADRVKEALFSMLLPEWPPHAFLDLYAGTGQIGLEAASRGAGRVVLVEQDRACCRVILANREKTRLTKNVSLLALPVDRALTRLKKQGCTFSLIFADPPYRQAMADFRHLSPCLAGLLTPGGLFILEHDAKTPAPANVTYLQLERCCQYGTAMLSFYQKAMTVRPPAAAEAQVDEDRQSP